MADATQLWAEVMPEVRNTVTGVGIWQALNNSQAVALDETTFVLGLPIELGDLAGHLRSQSTRVLIERALGSRLNRPITLRVIEGTSAADWELAKRRDEEMRKIQEAALTRAAAEVRARSDWESIYDQISRNFAALPNKSLPQSRAKFFHQCVDLLSESLRSNPLTDELAERNYARCLERVSQYSEVPSVLIAIAVNDKLASNG
ncbi:MAG: hypothetical protein JST40_01065 [Armatimonadetes bacterium]|nr:hypothetical protein [Armatimonadota bacterium]